MAFKINPSYQTNLVYQVLEYTYLRVVHKLRHVILDNSVPFPHRHIIIDPLPLDRDVIYWHPKQFWFVFVNEIAHLKKISR